MRPRRTPAKALRTPAPAGLDCRRRGPGFRDPHAPSLGPPCAQNRPHRAKNRPQFPKMEQDLPKIEHDLPKIEQDLPKIEQDLPKIEQDLTRPYKVTRVSGEHQHLFNHRARCQERGT